MKESATCSQCGHEYTYPEELNEKSGTHCQSCGALIHVKTGLPFGEAPTSISVKQNTTSAKAGVLPPIKKRTSGESTAPTRLSSHQEESELYTHTGKTNKNDIPAVSWVAWGLSLTALLLAFIYPSYGNSSSTASSLLLNHSFIIFICTAAILFIQGLAAIRR